MYGLGGHRRRSDGADKGFGTVYPKRLQQEYHHNEQGADCSEPQWVGTQDGHKGLHLDLMGRARTSLARRVRRSV
jgi:hypothetical protein